MTSKDIRKKLVGNQQAISKLVDLLVEDGLSVPLRELISPLETARSVVEGLRAWIESDPAQNQQLAWGARARDWLRAQERTVGELSGSAIEDTCLDLVARPYPPSSEILVFLLDRSPMRLLLRELFLEGLLTFGRKVRAPVMENPLARGLGGLGRMARERARSTSLGSLASDVADRLSDEMERQFEKRAIEFADAALDGLLSRLVDLLSNPRKADQQAALREALVEGLFALQTGEVADEFEKDDPAERGRIVRKGLGLWASSDDTVVLLRDLLEGLVADHRDRSLGEVLGEMKLLDAYRNIARDLVGRRMQPFLEGEAFASWLEELLGTSPANAAP